MEYIEYFFGNFWHFLELLILVAVIRGTTIIKIESKKGEQS